MICILPQKGIIKMSKSIKSQPKTIFHSTEKSNFILNMTEEQYSKLASYGLVIGFFMMPLFTLTPEINDEKFSYAMTAGGLAVAGVINMILAIIAIMKKYIHKAAVLPVCAFGAMLAWGAVSVINGYDPAIGFYGFTERGEGLLAILFYACFFITAASLKRRSAVNRVIKGVIGVGVFNSAIALVQIFAEKLTHYSHIGELGGKVVYINAASGLSMSPLFLAMVLTLALMAALIGFVVSESKKNRVICLVCAALFSYVMMFTYSIIGICGLALSLIVAAVSVFIRKAPVFRLICVPAAALFAALAVFTVNTGNVGNIDSYKLYDGRLLWWADGFMRAGASGNIDINVLDIDDNAAVYGYLNDKTIDIISDNKLTGTGPEQLAFPQIKTAAGYDDIRDILAANGNRLVFDKVYNEYLYTAATRGIPSLVILILILVPVIAAGVKNVKKRKYGELFIMCSLTVGGVLLFLVGCSSIAYAPIFWAVAGASCADADNDMKASAENADGSQKEKPSKKK